MHNNTHTNSYSATRFEKQKLFGDDDDHAFRPPYATTEQPSNGVILPLLVDVQPFSDDVLVL